MNGNKLKTCLALGLAVASLGLATGASADYIGNPNRPDTLWVNGTHCTKGYYVYFRQHPCCFKVHNCCGTYNMRHFCFVGYTDSWL